MKERSLDEQELFWANLYDIAHTKGKEDFVGDLLMNSNIHSGDIEAAIPAPGDNQSLEEAAKDYAKNNEQVYRNFESDKKPLKAAFLAGAAYWKGKSNITAEIMMDVYKTIQVDGAIKEEDKLSTTFRWIYELVQESIKPSCPSTTADASVLKEALERIQKELYSRSGITVDPEVNNMIDVIIDDALAQYNALPGLPKQKPFQLEDCELKPLDIKPPSFGRYVCLVKTRPMPYATYLKVLNYGIGFDGVEGFLQEDDDFIVTAWFSKFPFIDDFLSQSPSSIKGNPDEYIISEIYKKWVEDDYAGANGRGERFAVYLDTNYRVIDK